MNHLPCSVTALLPATNAQTAPTLSLPSDGDRRDRVAPGHASALSTRRKTRRDAHHHTARGGGHRPRVFAPGRPPGSSKWRGVPGTACTRVSVEPFATRPGHSTTGGRPPVVPMAPLHSLSVSEDREAQARSHERIHMKGSGLASPRATPQYS